MLRRGAAQSVPNAHRKKPTAICENLDRSHPSLDLKMKSIESRDKSSRGNASQFFIAGELCRRGYSAVITLGNTPNVDILCSNQQGTRFAHIQVKTFVPGNRTCSVGMKAMKNVGPTFLPGRRFRY